MEDATSLEEYDELQRQLFKVKGMTADEFDKLTPNAGIMDRFYVAGTTKGSIYVHDINVERAINALAMGDPPTLNKVSDDEGLKSVAKTTQLASDTLKGVAKTSETDDFAGIDKNIDPAQQGVAGMDWLMGLESSRRSATSYERSSQSTEGSIFVYDMKVESAIKNLLPQLMRMLTPIETTVTTAPPVEANFEMIPATMLEQAIVTATMQAATTNQAVAQSGGSHMVNAPTSIDNSSHQILTPPSSAHSPGVPPGSGHMGVSTPRG